LLSLVLWSQLAPAVDRIPLGPVVMFNTTCARCHEGECSQRMSFELPEGAADSHIRRYGGELSESAVRHLAGLLRHMKEDCGFYPFPYALVRDRVWDSDRLDTLRSSSGQAYFLPLGFLRPGPYRLFFEGIDDTCGLIVEVIDSDFDFVDHEGLSGEDGVQGMGLVIDRASAYFLRLSAQRPLSIRRLEIVSE
jgi:hypothetical protein